MMNNPGLNCDLPLQRLDITVTVSDIAYRVETTQSWKNSHDHAVEIHYTLPLPRNAVLLELIGQLGEKRLQAEVKAKAVAENNYEQAISDGNSAIHLQQLEAGLWGLSLGNLAAGEELTLTYRWIHRSLWQGNTLRLYIPTTIAPKFGRATVTDEFIPDITVAAAIPLDCRLQSEPLAQLDGEWHSPSHPLESDESGYRLAAGAEPDRDIIFTLIADQPPVSRLLPIKDGDNGYFQISRWHIDAEPQEDAALDETLWLVIDCSGSMAGDSIATAKTALSQIIDHLPPEQRVNLLAFGSSTHRYSRQPLNVTPRWRKAALRWVAKLEANLGGTELHRALDEIYRQQQQSSSRIVLLTDGEVWGEEALLERAKTETARFYTIGIGSAVSESLVRSLAEQSGGCCELVNPRENMTEVIERQTYRACRPVILASVSQSGLPSAPSDPALPHLKKLWRLARQPRPVTLHLGQPLTLIHHLPALADEWHLEYGEGKPVQLTAETAIDDRDLQRLAAAAFSPLWQSNQRAKWDQFYQLLGPETSMVAVLQREEAIETLPQSLKQPHLLAAGYGGSSGVLDYATCIPSVTDASLDLLEVPVFLRRLSSPARSEGVNVNQNDMSLAERIKATFQAPPPPPDPMTELLLRLEKWLRGHPTLTKTALLEQLAAYLYQLWCEENLPPLERLTQTEIEQMLEDSDSFIAMVQQWIAQSEVSKSKTKQLERLLQGAHD
ncbi:VWA domain-containing protein [Ectothiorhodospiraceae bacterium BW-2]|nr:VWA domain-containing protein [Ectothiorhodospiraceae bacterium BW-2]